MKRWFIAHNDYYFTASIHLEEAPWYIFALDNSIPYICDYIPRIPLPKIKIIKDGEKTNLKDYYGTIQDLFHVYICEHISNWCWNKTKIKSFNFPYFKLNNEFPELFEEDHYYDSDEYDKENEKYSKKLCEEFEEVYEKLEGMYEERRK